MLFQEHQAPSCLKPYVRYYWTLQMDALPASPPGQRLLTEGFEFILNLASPIEFINGDDQIKQIAETGITGPMSRPMWMRPTGPIHLFGICFLPGGGYPFFKYPANELVDQYPDVDDLWGAGGREFTERIRNDGRSVRPCIEAVNGYLIDRLASNLRHDPVTQEAIGIIEKCKGHITVQQLARHLGLSRRHLTRKFKERIGISPKQLCRNTRFKQVYKLIETASQDNWADVAVACGYYDQSHLINDFKHYTGSSPDAYFFSSSHVPDFFTANF